MPCLHHCWRGFVSCYQIMTSLSIIFISKYLIEFFVDTVLSYAIKLWHHYTSYSFPNTLIEFFSEQTIAAWPYTYIHSLGTFGQIIPLNDQNKSFVVYCNNRLTPSPYSTLFLFACHSCLTWHSWSSWTREYCRYLCTVVNINAGHFTSSLKNYTF